VYPKVAKVLRYGVQPAMLGAYGGYAAYDISQTWGSPQITQFKLFTYGAHLGAAVKGVYRFRAPEQIAGLRISRLSRAGYGNLRLGAPKEKFISMSRFTRGEGLLKYQELTQWRTGANKFLYAETAPGRFFDVRGAPIEFMTPRSSAIALGMGEFKGFKPTISGTSAEPMVRTTMLSRLQLMKDPFTYKQITFESYQPPTMRYTPIARTGRFTSFPDVQASPKTSPTVYTGGGKPIGTSGVQFIRQTPSIKMSGFFDFEYVPMSRLAPPSFTRSSLLVMTASQMKADAQTWRNDTAIISTSQNVRRMMSIQPSSIMQMTKPTVTTVIKPAVMQTPMVVTQQKTGMTQMMKQDYTYSDISQMKPMMFGAPPKPLGDFLSDFYGDRRKGRSRYRFREFKIPDLMKVLQ